MAARESHWGYDEQGEWGLLSEVDDRTLEEAQQARKEKVTDRALGAIANRIADRGYGQRSALAMAGYLLYQELPPAERQALQGIAETVATKAKQKLQDIDNATTNDDVDVIDPDA